MHTPERAALDAELFDTPPELLCPITQAVFAEPVLTASGHVRRRRPRADGRHRTRLPAAALSLAPTRAAKEPSPST